MKMAKAPKEHVDRLRSWLQFTDEIAQIDPENKREWISFKEDWSDEEDFTPIIKHCEDDGLNMRTTKVVTILYEDI